MTPDEARAAQLRRAERYRQIYTEDGGLRDLLERMTAELMARAADVPFNDTGKLHSIAIGIKTVAELNNAVARVIEGGRLAVIAQDSADRIASIPKARRKFF